MPRRGSDLLEFIVKGLVFNEFENLKWLTYETRGRVFKLTTLNKRNKSWNPSSDCIFLKWAKKKKRKTVHHKGRLLSALRRMDKIFKICKDKSSYAVRVYEIIDVKLYLDKLKSLQIKDNSLLLRNVQKIDLNYILNTDHGEIHDIAIELRNEDEVNVDVDAPGNNICSLIDLPEEPTCSLNMSYICDLQTDGIFTSEMHDVISTNPAIGYTNEYDLEERPKMNILDYPDVLGLSELNDSAEKNMGFAYESNNQSVEDIVMDGLESMPMINLQKFELENTCFSDRGDDMIETIIEIDGTKYSVSIKPLI